MAKFRKRAGSQSLLVTGVEEIDRKLNGLANKEKRKIVRASTNAGMTVFAKALRKSVDAEQISPQLKRAMKATVGRRFRKKKPWLDGMEAKVGFGVGKQKKDQSGKFVAKAAKRSGKNKTGVGLGSRNVHWFALGTRVRRVRKTGQEVGRIRQVRALQRALAIGRTLAFQQMKVKAAATLRDVARAKT